MKRVLSAQCNTNFDFNRMAMKGVRIHGLRKYVELNIKRPVNL